jgi:uncharacterized protein YjbI with pentapeptide repeats
VAEGFTCEVEGSAFVLSEEKPYRSACEELDFYGEHEGKRYCVLHYPGEEKKDDFRKSLESKLRQKDYDFGGAIFPDGTSNFAEAGFDGATFFAGATFIGRADFLRAKFNGEWTSFQDAQFIGERTSFEDAKFIGETTDFSEAHFSGKRTDFYRTQFGGKTTFFTGAQFGGETTNFSQTQFSGERTHFYGAQFGGETTDFRFARFGSETTYFTEAQFSGEGTDFYRTRFGGEATYFAGAQFIGETTDFRFAQFSGKQTDFTGARFSSPLDFYSTEFAWEVDLSSATFDKTIRLRGKIPEVERSQPQHYTERPEARFILKDIGIEQPDASLFQSLSLRPSWLHNVIDVRKLRLINVSWHDVTLEEELENLAGTDAPHELLARTCRELAANAEETRDYPLANSFYYWSMVALRKARERKLGWIPTIYWALSGYGVRPRRAGWILAAIWLIFTALYLLVAPRFSVFSAESFSEGIRHIEQALVYSLGALARLNPEPRPGPGWFQFLVTVEGLVGPLQIGLLLLAIRRQVMR